MPFLSSPRPLLGLTAALLATLFGPASSALAKLPCPPELDCEAPPPRPLSERDEEPYYDNQGAINAPGAREGETQPDARVWPPLYPTVGLSLHFGFIDEEFDLPGFGLWLGANYYPKPSRFNAFYSFGFKLERNQELRHRPFALVPSFRGGFAAFKGDPLKRKNQIFANVQTYVLLGRHLPVGEMPTYWRAGLGVSSPRIVAASAAMLFWGVPVPNQLELLFDFEPRGGVAEVLLVLGVGF